MVKAAEFYRLSIGGKDVPIEAYRGLGISLLRIGSAVEGKAALKDYLTRKPDAKDKAMVAMLAGG